MTDTWTEQDELLLTKEVNRKLRREIRRLVVELDRLREAVRRQEGKLGGANEKNGWLTERIRALEEVTEGATLVLTGQRGAR